jgi:hypothetical protein
MDPTIDQANRATQTFSEQINSYGDSINSAKGFLQQYQANQDKQRDDARNVIKDALAMGGGDALKGLDPKELADLEKLAGYPKGYIDHLGSTIKERELAIRAESRAAAGGLSSAQMNSTINQITGAFDNEPLVREYNTINSSVNYLKSLGTTPTDDIARIYAFAKTMDPTSAVREGEYKTVQDYATALLQRYGLNARRVFTNAGFLTDEARRFLMNTLQKRLDISASQYKNIYSQYQQRIEGAKSGGFNSLPDYSQTQFGDTGTGSTGTVRMKGPQGVYDVPSDKVEIFKQNGYTIQ